MAELLNSHPVIQPYICTNVRKYVCYVHIIIIIRPPSPKPASPRLLSKEFARRSSLASQLPTPQKPQHQTHRELD